MDGGGGGGGSETTNNSNSNTLLRPKFVSVFALCERCNAKFCVKYNSQHICSLNAKTETEANKKKKPGEKKKLPPPTAFYIFMNYFRETFEFENPSINVKNVAKLGGEMWKSFTEDEKKVYRDKAAQLMEEYNCVTEDAEEKQAENKEDAPNGGQIGRGRGRGILGRRKQSPLG